jgi:hypothetical protein
MGSTGAPVVEATVNCVLRGRRIAAGVGYAAVSQDSTASDGDAPLGDRSLSEVTVRAAKYVVDELSSKVAEINPTDQGAIDRVRGWAKRSEPCVCG